MRKLIHGVVEYRQKIRPGYRDVFARLALGQKPDALLISCSDSRVAVNLFASTDPGDLFVIRNVGNMIPPSGAHGTSETDVSEAAAVEFALLNLNVRNIIVCGHSECGAMQAVAGGLEKVAAPNLKFWLKNGLPAWQALGCTKDHNALSRKNVLQQIENLKSYPEVAKRVQDGRVVLHGWWFDIANAEVYAYDPTAADFVIIDEASSQRILQRLSPESP